jgi:amino acid adenylation domain-containing protein
VCALTDTDEPLYWGYGELPLLQLPTDYPRHSRQSFQEERHEFTLDTTLTDRLKRFSAEADVKLSMVLLAAYQILLFRYTGQETFLIGLSASAAPNEGCLDVCRNLTVHRADLSNQPTCRTVLHRICKASMQTDVHQSAPFTSMGTRIDDDQKPSLPLIIPLTFVIQFDPVEDALRAESEQRVAAGGHGSACPDISLSIVQTANGLSVRFRYNAELFHSDRMVRMADHLQVLLQGLIDHPDMNVGQLQLLTEAERRQLLFERNNTMTQYPKDKCIYQLFEQQVSRAPDSVAVVHQDEQLTYQELNTRANQLARYLQHFGVGPEVLVGLCVERSIEMVVGVLGVWKAGGAYVPLDPAYPKERLAYMLADSAVSVVLTQERLLAELPATDAQVVALDRNWCKLTGVSGENLGQVAGAENLAYVIYTSGSTGNPKGVLVEHRQLCNHHNAIARQYGISPQDSVLQFASVSFDVALEEIGPTLIRGATLILAPSEQVADLAEFTRFVMTKNLTVLNLPAAFWAAWTRHLKRVSSPPPKSLRLVVTGSEKVSGEACGQWEEFAESRIDWANAYGPTETTISATVNVISGSQGVAEIGTFIGQPIDNVRVYVLDSQMQLVPFGVPGELYIGGEGVARGYLNRPELTVERFLPDPFSGTPGARMYQTGDLVKWRPDGNLEIIGRIDNQVKIRGFRIELGEVEAAVQQAPGVKEAAVVVQEDESGDKRLIAFVVGETDTHAASLREGLKETLPEYMVPSVFVFLDSLPLTPNGKVDRKALGALPALDNAGGDLYVAPRNPAEELMAGIWQDVLHVSRVSVEDSFFELGGHSLLATQLVSHIQQVFGKTVPVRAVFEASTVVELTKRVQSTSDIGAMTCIPVTDRSGVLPLSYSQEQLWLIDQMQPGTALYNVPVVWRLRGALHVTALEQAIQVVVQRHESLRTVFATGVDGRPVQVIQAYQPKPLPVYDCTDEEHAQVMVGEEIHRPFDLAAGPLWRAVLIRLHGEEHLLAFTMHHVVSDGWSIGVLADELKSLYTAFANGEEMLLQPLSVQYPDYAAWQREWLGSGVLEQQLAYWREELKGELPLLQLPTDRPRPTRQTYHGSGHRFTLRSELLKQLRTLSQREGTTLFMTLLAAYQTLLMRYTGLEDILVGAPSAGRSHPNTENLIGFFVNTLVYRTDLSGNPSFRALLHRVRAVTLGAYEHQDVPFETLVKELHPKRVPSYSPIFQTMFVLQNGLGETLSLPGLLVKEEAVALNVAKFDLTLEMVENAEGLEGYLEFNTDLFHKETIERMAEHLKVMLQAVVQAPETPIGELPLLTERERKQILVEWNDTATEYPKDKCIHQLVEEQAVRTPDAIAVEYEEERLTYRELNERANQLAHHLRKLGVEPETLVGICVERSLEMVVGILGILKAGGAYVPMDPAYPKDRLAYMLEDTAAPVVLTQERLLAELPPTSARMIALDRDWSKVACEQRDNPTSLTEPKNLAYVIFTSGSTGKPKGVLLHHRGVVNLALEQIERYELDSTAKVIQLASFSFDASVAELLMALIPGGTLCLGKRENLMPGPSLVDFIRRHQITIATFTPPALQVMDSRAQGFESLRTIIVAGDACPAELAMSWGRNRRFFDAYGPTETTVCATVGLWEGEGSPHIGQPIHNFQVYVLNPYLQLVPVGVPGELYIGGAGVARGYLNRPDLTVERFLPDPFSPAPDARMYKTGDLVKWRSVGNLEYIGRIDNQVKVRGFRIELGEVEAAVQQASGVTEAAVIVREDEPGDKRLAAYVVGSTNTDATRLREGLKKSLPGYMVPSVFVFLNSLPLTPNGKVDRKALARLPAPDNVGGDSYVAPRDPAEELMAGIWQDVLHLSRVSVEYNFFELGGHSLLATQLVSRIQQVFGKTVPVRAVFEAPTVVELTKRVQSTSDVGAMTCIPLADRSNVLPLSYSQEQLWLIDQMEPGTALYNVPVVWRLRGALHVAGLGQAIQAVVERHESLRTVFATDADGRPVQVIHSYQPKPLPVYDCTDEEHAKVMVSEEIHHPFDLAAGPLWRAGLIRLHREEHLFVFTMHHVVSDGWSMGVLADELKSLYTAFAGGEESPLQALPVQYPDYALWQREWFASGVMEQQLAYWREKLGGELPLLQLPTARPRPASQTYHGSGHRFRLSSEMLEQLRVLSQREAVTLFMTLLAAYQILLMRYTGQEDILVGAPSAGRNRPETERLIGYFVNTLVYRTDLSANPSFRELLHRVRAVTLGAYEHQDVPFERLVAALQPKRDPSYSPIFQTMFVLQNGLGETLSLAGLAVEEEPVAMNVAKFDLTLEMVEDAEGLEGYLEYNTDLFDGEMIERMAEHLKVMLQAAVQAPESPIGELPMLTEAERKQILIDWNDTAAAYPRDKCIHQLFEEQAERAPDAVAVEYEEEHLTYRELNERANQLAHYLRKLGVQPETLVGICVERSLEMVVGILGILKAGGAYVPMDPAYPKDRLAYMLEDSAASVVLTQERLLAELPPTSARMIALDRDWNRVSREKSDTPTSLTGPENLAYVIYTSGSTGKPKGVLLHHRGVVNLALGQIERFELDSTAKVLQLASFSFDASVWELVMALIPGGTLCLGRREHLMPGPSLIDFIRRHQITIATFTPPALQVMDSSDDGLETLNTVIVAGEACSEELAKSWGRSRRFFDAYGPTETTVCATVGLWENEGPPHIGQPIHNFQIYVLNPCLQPVPVGVPGELYIGGVGVARGYLNRPELTAERFLADPFSPAPDARMYKTGDLVKWRSDGNLDYIGRIDNQVKIRGFRIELGEVEAAVQQIPGVKEAAIVLQKDDSGDKRIAAFVVAEDGNALHVSGLRSVLKERLPGYMVPSTFQMMEQLLLSPNGKVDRAGLAALKAADVGLTLTGEAGPRDTLELVMLQVWRQVLGTENIGIRDNFFDLGGHSLKVVVLRQAIFDQLRVDIPLSAFFTDATPASLCEWVRANQGAVRQSLVTLQTGSTGIQPPIFLVHEVSGGVLEYLDLCRAIGSDYTIYGFVAPGYDSDEAPLQSVHKMARQYVEEMRKQRLNGPYHLIGWSFGGLVAFEMARILEERGENIAFLGLLDSHPFGNGMREDMKVRNATLAQMADRLSIDANAISDCSAEEALEWLAKEVVARGVVPEKLSRAAIRRQVKVIEAHTYAIDEYRPSGRVETDITLFQAEDDAEGMNHDAWKHRTMGQLRVRTVPGTHFTMVHTPHASVLALAIRATTKTVGSHQHP